MSIIRSLPADFAAVLKKPGGLEKAFMDAANEAGLVFDTSKTLASVTRFDKKDCSGLQRVSFFDGQSTFPFQSNVQGTTKPNSEHDYYYAVRLQYGELRVLDSIYQPGIQADAVISQGLFNLSVNGVSQLVNVPIADFLGTNANITQMESGIYFLPVPIWWPGQTSVRAEISFPTAVTLENAALMLEFIGVGLVS